METTSEMPDPCMQHLWYLQGLNRMVLLEQQIECSHARLKTAGAPHVADAGPGPSE